MEKKYIFVYKCAKEFLNYLVNKEPKLNESILKQHLSHDSEFNDLYDVTKRMVKTLSNRNMMKGVINFDKKEKEIKKILFNFDHNKILGNYSSSKKLFKVFIKKFEVKNSESKKNLWRVYSKGIISGSKFISNFKDKKEFNKFVESFKLNKFTKSALPMIIGKEIDGFGFALACDFLKELGYREYPKPDVHLITIFNELELCNSSKEYEVYKSIIEMAKIVGEDAYTVDKIFWLIGSGDFYKVKEKIGRHREEFIQTTKRKLNELK